MTTAALFTGDRVIIAGVTKRPELNGVAVIVTGEAASAGRFNVQCADGRVFSLKLENLRHEPPQPPQSQPSQPQPPQPPQPQLPPSKQPSQPPPSKQPPPPHASVELPSSLRDAPILWSLAFVWPKGCGFVESFSGKSGRHGPAWYARCVADLVQTRSRARAADCFLVHTHGSICESHRAALERYWRAALRGHGSLVVEACDAGASPFLPVLLRTVPVIAWREEWARGAARRRPGGQSTPPHLDRACVL